MLLRNVVDDSLPRRGQPRLCICFRGTGCRISQEEKDQYHVDVFVMWQPKAWYDSATCNKYVVEYAIDEILKTDLKKGQRHLVLCDNLAGQTKKSNPSFSKLLLTQCGADVWNLLAQCTDEIQVVDAGFGALVKRFTEDVQMEWLQDEVNWAEWTGPNLSASRRRVLLTLWYGEGYERACNSYDFEKVFDRCGSNLTANGSGDSLIKLQGLEEFSFDLEDAKRDAMTGEMPQGNSDVADVDAATLNEHAADCSDNSEVEELSENDGTDDEDGGCTTDEEEGQPFMCPPEFQVALPCPDEKNLAGMAFAHRWEEGWFMGKIVRKVTFSNNSNQNGMFACKYPDCRTEKFHDLYPEDYGNTKVWVALKAV